METNTRPDRAPSVSLTILERAADARWQARQLVAHAPDDMEPRGTGWSGVFMGLAFTSDHGLFASEGNSGRIAWFDASGERRRAVDLNRQGYQDSYTGDLAIDPRRGILYAVDQANFRVAVVDIRSRQVIAGLPSPVRHQPRHFRIPSTAGRSGAVPAVRFPLGRSSGRAGRSKRGDVPNARYRRCCPSGRT
jgi:hypothetical protein